MARFTQSLISDGFAIGMTHYDDFYPGEEQFARMVLPIIVSRDLAMHAIVDTGAPWCIIDPEAVRQAGVVVRAGCEMDERLIVRGIRYNGMLFRMIISLEAERGNSLDIDATVFVPTLPPGDVWRHPNFIGLDGFLNRIRFAVDPAENTFYFGPI